MARITKENKKHLSTESSTKTIIDFNDELFWIKLKAELIYLASIIKEAQSE